MKKKARIPRLAPEPAILVSLDPRKLLGMIEALRRIDQSAPPGGLDSASSFALTLSGNDHHNLGALLTACEEVVNRALTDVASVAK